MFVNVNKSLRGFFVYEIFWWSLFFRGRKLIVFGEKIVGSDVRFEEIYKEDRK